jgi:hypothetical protein
MSAETRRRAPLANTCVIHIRYQSVSNEAVAVCSVPAGARKAPGHFSRHATHSPSSLLRRKGTNSPRCGLPAANSGRGKAIPCNRLRNSLVSKKKSLIPEKQFPANFAILARRFPTTTGNGGVLFKKAALSAEIWTVSGQQYGRLRKSSLCLALLFRGNARSRARD